MVKRYKKKPVIIEAIQYTGDNIEEITNFVGKHLRQNLNDNSIAIHTLEGDMVASINDYIIKGISNEFYPCKPDIFDLTYVEVYDNE